MTTDTKGVSPQTGADLTADMTREEASEIYDEAGAEYGRQNVVDEPETERSLSEIAEDVGVDTIAGPSEDYGMEPEEAAEMSASELYDQAGEESTGVESGGYEVFGIADRLKTYCREVGVDIVDDDTGYADKTFRRDRTGETESGSLEDAFESEGLIQRILG